MHNHIHDSVIHLAVQCTRMDPIWGQRTVSAEFFGPEIRTGYGVSSALDSSSGVVRMWVRIPAWPVAALVSLSKTLNHYCSVLRMERKAVGPVCCVVHVKESRTLIVKEKGLAPVFLDLRLEHPAGWICARYKSSVLLLLLLLLLLLWYCGKSNLLRLGYTNLVAHPFHHKRSNP